MYILLAALAAVVSVLLPTTQSFAQSEPQSPTAVLVTEDFSPMEEAWQPATGTWSVSGGTYGVSSAGEHFSLITSYRGVNPGDPTTSQLQASNYIVRARVRNQGTDFTHKVGLVYGYQDPQNYCEVVIDANGRVSIRTMKNGNLFTNLANIHTGVPRNTWIELEIRRKGSTTELFIGGRESVLHTFQPDFPIGQVGLTAHAAVGRFDKVFVGVPYGDQDFLEFVEEPPFVAFAPVSGQWAFENGTYDNHAVQQTNISLAPVHTGSGPGETPEYMFRSRMLNPYGGPGNLVGIVFNYTSTQYTEVVFSPTGVAKVNRFVNGQVTTLATTTYKGRRNVGFDVRLENSANRTNVYVDGELIFPNIIGANPGTGPQGGVGLITHWAPGRFDVMQFDHGIFRPCSFSFSKPPQSHWIVSGTWNSIGGTLNDTSGGASDIVNFQCRGNDAGVDSGTDAIIRARLLNPFSGSGNLVGLVYNYQGADSFYAGDYYEVVFSPTGVVQVNKFIQGVRYPNRTGTHSVPPNTWFDVEVERHGVFTRVRVNGVDAFSADEVFGRIIDQSELKGGSIGVITHFSKGRFDNVSLSDNADAHSISELP